MLQLYQWSFIFCSFTDLYLINDTVTKLDMNLTTEELRSLQIVGEKDLVWVEIGVTGVGKSTLGNFLLGKDAFEVVGGLESVTDNAQVDCSTDDEQRVCIVDTPGFGHTRFMATKNTEAETLASGAVQLIVALSKTMLMAQYGIHAFFVVVRADNRELFSTMKLLDLLDILGNYWNHSILVFTHGKELNKTSEEGQYGKFEAMLRSNSCSDVWQTLIEKVSNRYVIVEPEDWKDSKEYRVRKLMELKNHSTFIKASIGPYNYTLHSLIREYIEAAKLEMHYVNSTVDQVNHEVLQIAFQNIIGMLHRLFYVKLAGRVDTELLQKMAAAKEEQLYEVRMHRDQLHKRFLKEQEEKRKAQEAEEKHKAQEAEEKAREAKREPKERERAMAEDRRLALKAEEKARRELEEYLKKPTFAERVVETRITGEGFHNWEWKCSAEAVDVATGIKVKARNYYSKGGAKEHARINLKAILLERGVIRKD